MTPRMKALQNRAQAPPQAGSKKRKCKFGKFKERRFQKALELTRELYNLKELQKIEGKGKAPEETLEEEIVDAGWGVIVGSQKVQERLAQEGIKSTYNPMVAYENEIIVNRGKGSDKSNFFVFIKFGTFRTTAFFTDPSSGEGGKALPKKKLMQRFRTWRSKGNWVSRTMEAIQKLATRKRKESFFLCLHGHWGENKGHDDGVSPRRDVIREMMKWHYDVDATGYHNWVDKSMLLDVMEREKAVGITHIPSTEFTYRYIYGLGDNGFHINLWFADVEAAMDFHGKYLAGKAKNMPGMAPDGQKGVIRYIRRKRQDKKLAVGIAHPCCLLPVGRHGLEAGIIGMLEHTNEKGHQFKWRSIESFIRRNSDGVAAYNPTVGGREVSFADAEAKKEFKDAEVLVANYIGGDANLDENNVNMAIAYGMRHKYGKFIYFDHDTHNYAPTRRYFRAISPLAYGRTVLHLNKKRFDLLKETGGLTSQEIIEIMRGGRGVTLEAVDKVAAASQEEWMEVSHIMKGRVADKGSKISLEAFVELENERMREIRKRRDFTYHLLKVPREIEKGAQYIKLVWSEWKRRTKSMWRP